MQIYLALRWKVRSWCFYLVDLMGIQNKCLALRELSDGRVTRVSLLDLGTNLAEPGTENKVLD
jgi:hypothetical protein